MPDYFRPTALQDALEILAPGRAPAGLTVLAGGTDHFPARVGRPPAAAILDITAIAELAGLQEQGDHWRIGATARWSDILHHAGLPLLFDGLRQAAQGIGGVQVQNAGTIAGNLCTAAPAADGVPPLLAMDAAVELRDRQGVAILALADFIAGPGSIRLQPGQLVTAVLVPKPATEVRSAFRKLGARHRLAISIATTACALQLDRGKIFRATLAVGACSPTACRLPGLERRLAGKPLAPGLADLVEAADLDGLSPADDIRGSAGYRRAAAETLLRRMLEELALPVPAARAGNAA